MKAAFFCFLTVLIMGLSTSEKACAQQYKLRQVSDMMNMKTESTIFVKGMRKRTEAGSMMGMPAPPITIEQCDLQRTIKINDKKKLYFIEPFSKETEEVIDEDEKPVAPVKTKPVKPSPVVKTASKTGGIVYMYYNITDTGERKKMSGFTARHLWTTQKIKPSENACSMKDSILIKTDGWYIDLPQFNCPVKYRPAKSMMPPSPSQAPSKSDQEKPDCQDKFVTRRSGKGKLGFALTETKTMIMGGQANEFTTSIETLEFSTVKLDSMLFEIPPGYKEAASEDELREQFKMSEMIDQYKKEAGNEKITSEDQKKEGMIRVGVFVPVGDDNIQASALQEHMVNTLMDGSIEAVAVTTEEEAKKLNCDYTLASNFTKIKPAGKVGGLLKAIKNADPSASSSFTIEASQTLVKLSDGSTRLQPKISGKFEGKIDAAAEKALDDGCYKVLKELK